MWLLASYEASAEEVVACFSSENQNSVQQCLLATCCFTQEERAMLHVTTLAYTNSRLETGIQSVKSHIEEADVFSHYP
jgi:hypothetical protein